MYMSKYEILVPTHKLMLLVNYYNQNPKKLTIKNLIPLVISSGMQSICLDHLSYVNLFNRCFDNKYRVEPLLENHNYVIYIINGHIGEIIDRR